MQHPVNASDRRKRERERAELYVVVDEAHGGDLEGGLQNTKEPPRGHGRVALAWQRAEV